MLTHGADPIASFSIGEKDAQALSVVYDQFKPVDILIVVAANVKGNFFQRDDSRDMTKSISSALLSLGSSMLDSDAFRYAP